MLFNFNLVKASVLAFLAVGSLASPIELASRVAVPDAEACKKAMTVPKDGAVFYSGVDPGRVQDMIFDQSRLTKGGIIESFFNDPKYPENNGGFDPDDAVADLFWDNCSQAMAELASGLVYVVLPGDVNQGTIWPSMDSVWARKEWPYLAANNGLAKKVVRIRPEADKEADEMVILDIVI